MSCDCGMSDPGEVADLRRQLEACRVQLSAERVAHDIRGRKLVAATERADRLQGERDALRALVREVYDSEVCVSMGDSWTAQATAALRPATAGDATEDGS